MKKFLSLVSVILVLILVFALAACSCTMKDGKLYIDTASSTEQKIDNAKTESTEQQMAPNPMHEASSIDDLNKKIGCELEDLDDIAVTNVEYYTIDGEPELAQVMFEYKGGKYTYRSAKTDKDISGVYTNDGKTLGDVYAKDQKPVKVGDKEYYARWFDDNYQYSLYGQGVSEKDFTEIYDELD